MISTLKFKKFLFVIALGFVFILHGTSSASAQTVSVQAGSGDVNTGDPGCSLAEAMHNINDNAQTYTDCPSLGGGDTISLPAGTINLTQDLPVVDTPFNVVGAGRNSSIIDGGGVSTLFSLSLPTYYSNAHIIFSDFSAKNISQESGARCIAVGSENSVVTLNQSVDIENVDLENCGQYSIALGLFGSNDTINNVNVSSTLGSNFTLGIVSIYPAGLTLKNSSVSGYYIGIYHFVFPGAPVRNSVVDVENTTATQNRVGTLIYSENSPDDPITVDVKLYNNTIAGNSAQTGDGGFTNITSTTGLIISAAGNSHIDLDMKNNVIANNLFDSAKGNCFFGAPDYVGNVSVTTSKNLSDDTCAGKFGGSDLPNITNFASTISILQDNGGEIKTMALIDGSAAIDAGTTIGSLTTDARGITRPQNSVYDIGAYEKTSADPSVPGPTDPPPDPGVITPTPPRTGVALGIVIVVLSSLTFIGFLLVNKYKKHHSLGVSEK